MPKQSQEKDSRTIKLAQFSIPAIPPSVNEMYKINYIRKYVYADQSVVDFKNIAMKHIPQLPIKNGIKLLVEVEYHGRFLNKTDGLFKRRDGQNLDKCLYDIMFDKFGIDDKNAWKGTWEKIHNPGEEYTLVTISEIRSKKCPKSELLSKK